MSASGNSQDQQLPAKEEFFDAVRRHICQALGFDFVFVDIVRESELVNVHSFSAEDDDKEAGEFVDTLVDENKQPLVVPNSTVAQKVRQSQNPYIGTVSRTGDAVASEAESTELDEDDEEAGLEESGYPYSIVPILQTSQGGGGAVRGLIRVVSFDPSREVTQQDLATLKLMGEHLSSKMAHFAPTDAQQKEQSKAAYDSEHVLLVHSNRLVRRRFSRILTDNYQVLESDNAEKALETLLNNRVDLIVLDADAKTKGGKSFCSHLKESAQHKHVPVILVTSDANPNARVEALNDGADDCLSESCFDSELTARVRSSMRHRKTERELAIQLQLLEDYAKRLEQATENMSKDKKKQLKRNDELKMLRWESDILRSQDTLLHRISNTIRQSFNIEENLHSMLQDFTGWRNLDSAFVILPSEEEPADSIRTEYYNDEEYRVIQHDYDLKILEVFKKYFQDEQLLMANDAQHDRRLEPFRKGALPSFHFFSLFVAPITYEQKLLGILGGFKCESQANWNRDNETFVKSVADQLAAGVTNARLYARVQRQATTDGLTGLLNHRTGQEKLAEQLRLAERYQRNLAVVMIDVDHFKSINDNYGHPAGDSVLKSTAKLVKSDCRDVDLPVRYGGEEFLLVLPEVNQEGAAVVAERIRKNLSQEVIHHEDIQISVTASFGIAAFPEDAQNQQQLLDLADKALYLSKRLGRNQVHTAGDLMFEEISPRKASETGKKEHDENEELEDDEVLAAADEMASKPIPMKPSPPAQISKQTPSDQLITLPSNTYADFVPTTVSAAAEQKEELVPEVVEMVKALATALYSKSDYNKQHHLETARLSELLAKVMGLSQQQVEQIRVAGLLHDVGTLSIPSDLLNKPGKYNADEREIINQHAVLGAQLLRPIRALKDICEILENHHERWDGTGYPRGLRGEEIPLAARIVAIVDSYHAMISDRPYRDALTREQAVQTLRSGAGTQWDPFLVDIFVAVLASLNDPRSTQPLPQPGPKAVPALPDNAAAETSSANANTAPSASSAQMAGTTLPASSAQMAGTTPSPNTTPSPVPDQNAGAAQQPMNARQRLLQNSQQNLQRQDTPSEVPSEVSSAPATRADDSGENEVAKDNSLDQEKEDLAFQQRLSERSEKSALEQLRRTPPAAETISRAQQLFAQPSQPEPELADEEDFDDDEIVDEPVVPPQAPSAPVNPASPAASLFSSRAMEHAQSNDDEQHMRPRPSASQLFPHLTQANQQPVQPSSVPSQPNQQPVQQQGPGQGAAGLFGYPQPTPQARPAQQAGQPSGQPSQGQPNLGQPDPAQRMPGQAAPLPQQGQPQNPQQMYPGMQRPPQNPQQPQPNYPPQNPQQSQANLPAQNPQQPYPSMLRPPVTPGQAHTNLPTQNPQQPYPGLQRPQQPPVNPQQQPMQQNPNFTQLRPNPGFNEDVPQSAIDTNPNLTPVPQLTQPYTNMPQAPQTVLTPGPQNPGQSYTNLPPVPQNPQRPAQAPSEHEQQRKQDQFYEDQ